MGSNNISDSDLAEFMRTEFYKTLSTLAEIKRTLESIQQNLDLLMAFIYDALSELRDSADRSNRKPN